MIKKALPFLCLIAFCTVLCSCGKSQDTAPGDKVEFRLTNTVEGQISVLTLSWSDTGNMIASTDVEIAGGGKYLEARTYSFELTRDEIENEEALKDLIVSVSISDKSGVTQTLSSLELPSKFGDKYDYELCFNNGSYSIKESK